MEEYMTCFTLTLTLYGGSYAWQREFKYEGSVQGHPNPNPNPNHNPNPKYKWSVHGRYI